MGSAASFFGHTLLRLNHDPNSPEATPLLDYGVNYAADPTTFNPMLYAMLGMTGGFQGTFSSIPYYLKVEEYADFERRDIWEYDLNLSQAELDRLLVHLWTLGQFRIRYFYFDMNCSYMLLTLLDAAKPELSLAERFHGWVIPSDTLHALNDVPGLVSRVGYRPSSLSRLRFLADRLNADERKLFFDLVELKRSPDQMLKQPPSVATLDASLEYFRFKKAAQSHRLTPDQSLQNQMLLIARSQMPEPAPDFSGLEANRKPDAPEAGHRSARIQLAGGINPRNSDTFTELGYRAAFHDLNAYPIGFAPLSQVELFQLKLRYYDDRKKFRLNQLDLVSVYSLSPISSLLARPSWAAELGLRPARQSSCVDCLEWVGSYGPGATTTLFGDQRGVSVFMLARLEAAIASSLAPWARLDVVPDMGVLVHPHERISLLSRAQYVTRLAGRDESFLRMSHELRANFDAHKELRFSFDRVRTHSEAKLTFGLYF